MTRFAIETNILIYAVSNGSDARDRAALEIVRRAFLADAVVPLQVLGEFCNVCRRKRILAPERAVARIVEWLPLFLVPQTEARHLLEASQSAARYNIQFFDALIGCVAKSVEAEYLLSEDMQDGMDFDGLIVVNPFVAGNRALVDRLLDGEPT